MASDYHLMMESQDLSPPLPLSAPNESGDRVPLLTEEERLDGDHPPNSFCQELQLIQYPKESASTVTMGTGRYPMRYYWIACGVFGLLMLGLGLLIGFLAAPSSSKSDSTETPESYKSWSDALKGEDEGITEKLLEILQKSKIEEHLRYLTSKPHLAGTTADRDNAYYVKNEFTKYGLDHIEVIPYDVLLSYPDLNNTNHAYLLSSNGDVEFTSKAYEKPLTDIENRTDIVPPFNAYAANGTVKGQLVYVNYARIEDFQFLERNLSVDVTGKIVIARYGKIFRGDKAHHAEIFGAAGLILYSDPKDYATEDTTEVYPKEWWLPGTGVQRGTLWLSNGDPLTPAYPSLDSAFREDEESITGLPHIPVHPIGYDDAMQLLKQMDGVKAPNSWQGNLDITYNIGPDMKDNRTVKLEVNNKNQRNYTYTTVGYIKGSLEPDRYVIIGNHRDAWVFGSVDPSSGTACMLELARAFQELITKHNWRPRRTIVFCSWGAEEYGLIGSTEWVEENMKTLSKKAVVYLNVDISVQGNHAFRAKSSPSLYQVIYDVTKKIKDPNDMTKTVYQNWLEKVPKEGEAVPYIGNLGSGSDYAPFMNTLGVSSMDLRYDYDQALGISSYPLYHSMYETFHLMENTLDPDFTYHLVVSQVWGEMARTFADSLFLPFNCEDYGKKMKQSMDGIKDSYEDEMNERNIKFDDFYNALDEFESAANDFHAYIESVESNVDDPFEVRGINDKLMYLERSFVDPIGLPDRLLDRHVVFAPSSKDTYVGDAFPGLVDALFDIDQLEEPAATKQWKVVEKHLSVLTYFVHGAAKTLKEVFDEKN
ncbi:N-acetylated-alpha-linked acidic dipeptidase 2-like [Glandiceps talaboti]